MAILSSSYFKDNLSLKTFYIKRKEYTHGNAYELQKAANLAQSATKRVRSFCMATETLTSSKKATGIIVQTQKKQRYEERLSLFNNSPVVASCLSNQNNKMEQKMQPSVAIVVT